MPDTDLRVRLTLQDTLSKGFDIARRSVQRFARGALSAVRGVGGAIRRLTRSLFSLRTLLIGLASGLVLRGISRLVQSVTTFGDQLAKLNTRLGLSAEFLSEMRFVAESAGVEFRTLEQGLQRMVRRFGQLQATGTGEALQGLEILGQDLVELVKQGSTVEELLPTIADRFKELGVNSEQAAFAIQKLADTEGVKLLQFLKEGSAGIERMRQRARQLGVSFSGELARNSEKFTQAIFELTEAFRGLLIRAIEPLIPALTQGLESLTQFFIDNRGAILEWGATLLDVASEAIPALDRALVGLINTVKTAASPVALLQRGFLGRESNRIGQQRSLIQAQIGFQNRTRGDAAQIRELSRRDQELAREQNRILGQIRALESLDRPITSAIPPGLQPGLQSAAAALRRQAQAAQFPFVGPPVSAGGPISTGQIQPGIIAERKAEAEATSELQEEIRDLNRRRASERDSVEGVVRAFGLLEDELSGFAVAGRTVISLFQGFRSSLSDFIVQLGQDMSQIGQIFKGFVQSLIGSISRSFADAGADLVVSGLARTVARIPLFASFQQGGISQGRPGIVSERGQPEAVIPLPGGSRAVPVQFQGDGPAAVVVENFTIQALDARSVSNLMIQGARLKRDELARLLVGAITTTQTQKTQFRR